MADGMPQSPNADVRVKPNPGKRKNNKSKKNKKNGTDADGSNNAPDMPPGLTEDAAKIWDEVVAELEKLNVLARVDNHLIAIYCNTVARAQKMQRHLDEHGYTYVTRGRNGEMERARPQVAILETCEKQMRAFAQEWGMSAAARGRLKVNDGQGDLFDDPTAL